MKRAILVASTSAVLVLAAAAAWMKWAPRHAPAGQPPLTVLSASSLPDVRAAFNRGVGEVRVLVLLSPT